MTTTTVLTAHQWAVEVDTVLAQVWEAQDTARGRRESLWSSCHYGLDEKAVYRSKFVKDWPTTGPEAEALFREKVASGGVKSWDMASAQRTLEGLDKVAAEIATLAEVAAEFEAEYTGWQRFFLVTNNNGHIHATMSCSTCYWNTRFAWLPDLSGLTEAEAVEAQGPLLCSVCFPSAPVEWTLGKAKPAGCPGSGKYVEPRQGGNRRYASCPVCEEYITRTSTGVLRKHPPKKES